MLFRSWMSRIVLHRSGRNLNNFHIIWIDFLCCGRHEWVLAIRVISLYIWVSTLARCIKFNIETNSSKTKKYCYENEFTFQRSHYKFINHNKFIITSHIHQSPRFILRQSSSTVNFEPQAKPMRRIERTCAFVNWWDEACGTLSDGFFKAFDWCSSPQHKRLVSPDSHQKKGTAALHSIDLNID